MSVRDYGLAAPHGPNMNTDEHVATAGVDMSNAESAALQTILKPSDLYDENGNYWADMPFFRQLGFNARVDHQEAMSELRSIGRMIKADPLSPVGYYLKNMVLPGAGLLLEGYVLFSIGNISPLLQAAFPKCWVQPASSKNPHPICNTQWVYAVQYLEIIGIICGQIMVGILGDWLGRRWGLIQDATIMFIGLLMLTAAWGVTENGWVICYAWSLWFYSVGVGGEYPMTATSGMENAVGSGKISTRDDRLHRGRKVTSAFLMQGWGQMLNQVVLILLLLIFHHGSGNPPYSKLATQWTLRVSFAIPAVGTLWLVYYRAYKMRAASKQLLVAKRRSNVTGYDRQSLKLVFTYFGPRVIATAGGWFMNDVLFYGNKLYQGKFIKVITNNKSVMVGWLYNLINIGVQLVGYYLASFLIDNKFLGRKWMQILGFMMMFILFTVPAFNYDYYTTHEHIHAFQAMYFLSSFFNQFGPNSVTFIVAAEVYPTPIRATAHGFSAACGKLGALLPAILYNYLDAQTIFKFVPWFGLAGALLTLVFLPDTTGLDLKEQERRWQFIRAGREYEYHGIAIHPRHLSFWERFVKRKAKYYDPELDYQQKVEELRHEWVERQQEKAGVKENVVGDFDDDEYSEHLHHYFTRTTRSGNGSNGADYSEKKVLESDDGSAQRDTTPPANAL